METNQIYMITEAGIKVLTDQITENILKAINPSKTSDEDAFLSIDETAKIINLSKATIYGLTHQKEIPFHKRGKRLYFLKSEILQWIKSGKRESKSELEKRAEEYLSKNRLF
ncbi:helix-turn-helix domain-containing protein [Flavobacterium maritimum]|jgi:excisionase family DNA binding protein|uniref:helix-turn-helix domain-containing protein n=1 Tax=Flavobacterium maritimum TaxID=3149042 RepID=UPI0032B39566